HGRVATLMARQRMILTLLWWCWGVALIVVMVILSNQPVIFGDDPKNAWDWFVPNLSPTLLLVGGVAIRQRGTGKEEPGAPGYVFMLTLLMSILYLLALTVALVSVVFVTNPVAELHKSNIGLGVIQGLAASFLGVFFTGGSGDSGAKDNSASEARTK